MDRLFEGGRGILGEEREPCDEVVEIFIERCQVRRAFEKVRGEEVVNKQGDIGGRVDSGCEGGNSG